jgi:hypothetical protein
MFAMLKRDVCDGYVPKDKENAEVPEGAEVSRRRAGVDEMRA